MRTLRKLQRPRESRPRKGGPIERPSQTEINKNKASNLPFWRRKAIEKSLEVAEETARKNKFYATNGWAELSPA